MSDRISSSEQEIQPMMSLREHKKRQAQIIIEETALRLFQRQGYEQTSIHDIADAVKMSSRTFFRYFSSKEDVLTGPMYAMLDDAILWLQQADPMESPHTILRATVKHLSYLYQQQQASCLVRYQVAARASSIASIYLYILLEAELALCDALCSHLKIATKRNEIRLLVGIYMTAFRVAVETWMRNGTTDDLHHLLEEQLGYISPLSRGI